MIKKEAEKILKYKDLHSPLLPASQPILSDSSQLLFHVDHLYFMTSFSHSLKRLQFWMVHISHFHRGSAVDCPPRVVHFLQNLLVWKR